MQNMGRSTSSDTKIARIWRLTHEDESVKAVQRQSCKLCSDIFSQTAGSCLPFELH
jgi:hypothetical protein